MLKDTFLLGAGLNSKRHISWTKTQTKYQVDVAISDVDNIFIDLYNAVLHYENMPIQIYWNFHHQKKTWKFSDKNSDIFLISTQNIDCGYSLGGSNEYPQSMFVSRNKKNNVNPCKPLFYYIKVGFKGVKII